MPDAIDDAKRALRADLRERRQIRSEAARAEAAEGLRAQLDALVAELGARSVSCYLSLTTEPGTHAFLDEAMTRGLRVLLPVSRDDGRLDWAVAGHRHEVQEGLFGLPEPTGDLLGPIAVEDVDLMIVPAAAVDRSGMRLGWGRGYFDRTLGSLRRQPPVYAVVFDSELRDEIPYDVHDQPVTGIVTPTRTITFAPRPR
ncbi:5-formyltetrahydrofolate cyclo-ligase [Microbacterium sp. X-17]|uniref:5-formyltetrahydrofolate cyclo-ligase n=1 Tax=Microbacterium sp. X-17 TaxID=3144404 RepID=UPI0031F59681